MSASYDLRSSPSVHSLSTLAAGSPPRGRPAPRYADYRPLPLKRELPLLPNRKGTDASSSRRQASEYSISRARTPQLSGAARAKLTAGASERASRLRRVYTMSDLSDGRRFARDVSMSRDHVRTGLHPSESLPAIVSEPGERSKRTIGFSHPSCRTAAPMFAGVYILPPRRQASSRSDLHSPNADPAELGGDRRRAAGRRAREQGRQELKASFRHNAEANARENEVL
jgi:hypothetical protein